MSETHIIHDSRGKEIDRIEIKKNPVITMTAKRNHREHRGWISVKDRYPDDARDVRAYSPEFGIHTACFERGAEDDPCWWSDEVKSAAYKESVTHWREIES